MKTQTPKAIVLETLRTASLATCMELMLRFVRVFFFHCVSTCRSHLCKYRDLVVRCFALPFVTHLIESHQETAFYVQRQLNLTDSQVQDFFEVSQYPWLREPCEIEDFSGCGIPCRFPEDSCRGFTPTARREVVFSAKLWFSAHATQCMFAGVPHRRPRCHGLTLTLSRCYQTEVE